MHTILQYKFTDVLYLQKMVFNFIKDKTKTTLYLALL